MTSNFFSPDTNLAEILGFSPEFTTYLVKELAGKKLETKFIRDNGSKLSVTLTFCDRILNKVKHDKFSRQPPRSQNKLKRKSPSRLRRDSERLKEYRQRKKQYKQQQISRAEIQNSHLPLTPQCPPPPDESVTVSPRVVIPLTHPVILSTSPPPELPPRSADDSWTTVGDGSNLSDDDAPLESPSQPSVTPVDPAEPDQPVPQSNPPVSDDAPLESPSQPSVTPVAPVEPDQPVSDPTPVNTQPQASLKDSYKPVQERFLELYTECGYCQLPSSECSAGLKPCSRCLCRAYCSKDCQRKDWKQGHKECCSEEQGARMREVRRRMLETEAQLLPTGP